MRKYGIRTLFAGGLKGRLTRRSLLAEGWFFACQCKRYFFQMFTVLGIYNFAKISNYV
jgi:hypothetical protein